MIKNCLICGVGGQGSILASKLISDAAMNKGFFTRTAETIGMAQRGGSVVSHLRIGDEIIYSPMLSLSSADVVISFEPGEAVRAIPYLKKDGLLIVNKKSINPVTASLGKSAYSGDESLAFLKSILTSENLIIIDGDEICKKSNSNKVINTAMLGVVAKSNKLGIGIDDIKKSIFNRIPEKFHDINLIAVNEGSSLY